MTKKTKYLAVGTRCANSSIDDVEEHDVEEHVVECPIVTSRDVATRSHKSQVQKQA
jgi:hypothetical protein